METLAKLAAKPRKNCFASSVVKPRTRIRSIKKRVKKIEIFITCFLFRIVLILWVYLMVVCPYLYATIKP